MSSYPRPTGDLVVVGGREGFDPSVEEQSAYSIALVDRAAYIS